jgi:hypothetical protein
MAETIGTYSVPEHYVKMYTSNVRAALNRNGGLLKPYVSQGSYTGEKVQVVDFLGPVEFVIRDTPYADTQVSELEHTSRWIAGSEYDAAIFVDRLDTLKMIYDPTSPYVERMREAAARRYDQIIMDKMFATAQTGKDGTVATPFRAANQVVNGGVGFTTAKLRALRKLMKKRYIDLRNMTPNIAVNSESVDDLLGETEVGSSDFNSIKPLVNGEVSKWMGFNFIPYEDWGPVNGFGNMPLVGGIRSLPAWVPSGMHFGTWQDLVVRIDNRPDKNNIKQIHATFTAGATRLDEDKVFGIEWQDS